MTYKWIEITTRIGCKNMCGYCPQKTFISNYKGTKKMALEDFSKILKHVDKNTTQVHFSGFSEAFLNEGSEEMMLLAFKEGFQVVLYTTLEGISPEKINFLYEGGMHFSDVRFHEFDGVGYNKTKFNNNVKLFKKISSDNYQVDRITRPLSRGGHLFKAGYRFGKLTCHRFDCNVALPNGDVYLCCSDWGLDHYLGNIFDNHYDSGEFQLSRDQIRLMAAKRDSNLLCRKCEWAVSL
jgi:radical SAM protein with 4Fe4S-binding SPASM domain